MITNYTLEERIEQGWKDLAEMQSKIDAMKCRMELLVDLKEKSLKEKEVVEATSN